MDICEKRSIRPASTLLFPKENFPAGAAFPPPAGKIRYTEGRQFRFARNRRLKWFSYTVKNSFASGTGGGKFAQTGVPSFCRAANS